MRDRQIILTVGIFFREELERSDEVYSYEYEYEVYIVLVLYAYEYDGSLPRLSAVPVPY